MKTKVLPIVKVNDTTGAEHFINVYQIVAVKSVCNKTFQIRLNNYGSLICEGNYKEFVDRISK